MLGAVRLTSRVSAQSSSPGSASRRRRTSARSVSRGAEPAPQRHGLGGQQVQGLGQAGAEGCPPVHGLELGEPGEDQVVPARQLAGGQFDRRGRPAPARPSRAGRRRWSPEVLQVDQQIPAVRGQARGQQPGQQIPGLGELERRSAARTVAAPSARPCPAVRRARRTGAGAARRRAVEQKLQTRPVHPDRGDVRDRLARGHQAGAELAERRTRSAVTGCRRAAASRYAG